MSILSSLQDPILPIFMALLAGFFMRRVKFFDALGAQGINRFVFLRSHARASIRLGAQGCLGSD
jgi:hypothetical protein